MPLQRVLVFGLARHGLERPSSKRTAQMTLPCTGAVGRSIGALRSLLLHEPCAQLNPGNP